MSDMEIIFLGTSAGTPTKKRNVSSILIRRKSDYLLFDVGEATQRQLIKTGIGLRRKIKIFISHMHGDHVVGLLSLLQSYSLLKREDPLEIYGPNGISEFIMRNISMLKFTPTYPILIQVLKEGVIMEAKEYIIRATKADHSVETYAFSIEEKMRPGKFDPIKARKLGIPVAYWKDLQMGRKVVINNIEIDPSLVVSPPRRGRKVVISSDTRPSDRIIEFARNADILIHDSTYGEEHADKAIKNYHSTAKQAAEVAKKAGVRLLILTHFSARYEDTKKLVEEAREIFPFVMAAEDFLRIDVPYPES